MKLSIASLLRCLSATLSISPRYRVLVSSCFVSHGINFIRQPIPPIFSDNRLNTIWFIAVFIHAEMSWNYFWWNFSCPPHLKLQLLGFQSYPKPFILNIGLCSSYFSFIYRYNRDLSFWKRSWTPRLAFI